MFDEPVLFNILSVSGIGIASAIVEYSQRTIVWEIYTKTNAILPLRYGHENQ